MQVLPFTMARRPIFQLNRFFCKHSLWQGSLATSWASKKSLTWPRSLAKSS